MNTSEKTTGQTPAQQTKQEFNPEFILNLLDRREEALHLAVDLDKAMHYQFRFFMDESGSVADDNMYYSLRQLRNALLQGSTGIELED